MLLTLLLPKVAHAVVATLVQVVNTTANPVPNLDTERIARIPYESTQQPTGNCPSGSGVQQCIFDFTPAPAGYRLIVQSVSGSVSLQPGTTAPPTAILINGDNGRYTYWSFTGTLGQTLSGAMYSGFNQPALAYYDPGDSGPAMYLVANYQAGVGQYMTLTGYLENCAVAGCTAKVH
jgi:hypothetical protein